MILLLLSHTYCKSWDGQKHISMISLIITISLTVKGLKHKVSILKTLIRNGTFLWLECVMKRTCGMCVSVLCVYKQVTDIFISHLSGKMNEDLDITKFPRLRFSLQALKEYCFNHLNFSCLYTILNCLSPLAAILLV